MAAPITRTLPARPERYDAVIVGARVAGAATGMLLARRGLRVLVVDRARPGSDTLSTHALMRAGVSQLQRWGVLDRIVAAGTPAVRRTTFHYADGTVPIDIKDKDGANALYAPRRTVLDPALAAAAEQAGAEVRFGVQVTGLQRHPAGRVTGILGRDRDGRTVDVRAPITIGADGLRSIVARSVEAPLYRRGAHGGAVLYGYWSGLEHDGYEWCYAPGATGGLIPTNDGLTVVWAGGPQAPFMAAIRRDRERAFREALQRAAPQVTGRVAVGRRVGPLRGFPGVPGYLRQAAGPGWALVGDAGYFKDPITAHGITDALRDADLLARAIADAGTPEALLGYQHARDRLSLPLLMAADEIASFRWDMPRLRKLLMAMNTAMNAESAALAALDGAPVTAAA